MIYFSALSVGKYAALSLLSNHDVFVSALVSHHVASACSSDGDDRRNRLPLVRGANLVAAAVAVAAVTCFNDMGHAADGASC